jgi:uncharacterized protein YcbK (DUF882 family)
MHHLFSERTPVSRRSFLKAGLIAGAALALPVPAFALPGGKTAAPRVISLFNVHTGERLNNAVFWENGRYLDDALREIDHLLRDYRTDEVLPIDPGLLDILNVICRKESGEGAIQVISGYRSPATNAELARRSDGVARHSLHMEGKAIDIRLPGCDLAQLRRTAISLGRGGVGYYPGSGFVHVDTGRVRAW